MTTLTPEATFYKACNAAIAEAQRILTHFKNRFEVAPAEAFARASLAYEAAAIMEVFMGEGGNINSLRPTPSLPSAAGERKLLSRFKQIRVPWLESMIRNPTNYNGQVFEFAMQAARRDAYCKYLALLQAYNPPPEAP